MNQTINIPLTIKDGTPEWEKEEIIAEVRRFVARMELSQRLRQAPDIDVPYDEQMKIINAEVKAYREEQKTK